MDYVSTVAVPARHFSALDLLDRNSIALLNHLASTLVEIGDRPDV